MRKNALAGSRLPFIPTVSCEQIPQEMVTTKHTQDTQEKGERGTSVPWRLRLDRPVEDLLALGPHNLVSPAICGGPYGIIQGLTQIGSTLLIVRGRAGGFQGMVQLFGLAADVGPAFQQQHGSASQQAQQTGWEQLLKQ